jgi:phosphatidylserine decarboxylase
MFHKEGYRIIMNTFVLVAAIAVLAEYKISIEWIKSIVQITALILLILVLQFFRNPNRTTPKNEKHLISPVDGKVVIVQEVF